jgi:hypothetical protein
LRRLLVILLVGSTSSCQHIIIKDAEWCSNLVNGDAYCVHSITGAKRYVAQEQWDKERVGMVSTKAENYANIKEVIKQLCSQTNDCYFDKTNKVLVINLNGTKK